MALEYSLELEGDPVEWDLVLSVLSGCKVRDIEFYGGIPKGGLFERSGMYFRAVDRGSLKEVSAEDFPKNLFLSRYVLVFRLNIDDLDESVRDVHDFLFNLALVSPRQFVLSHQFEEVHSYRTDRFVWKWE